MLLCRLISLRPLYLNNGQITDDPQNKRYSQVWTIENSPSNPQEQRTNSSAAPVRPIYLISQPRHAHSGQSQPTYVSRATPPDERPVHQQRFHHGPAYVTGRNRDRGVNSSPPDYRRGRDRDASASSESVRSRGSPPRGNNWSYQREPSSLTSGIPVPDHRLRVPQHHRHRAYHQHLRQRRNVEYNDNMEYHSRSGHARNYRTKSPPTSRTDSIKLSQDSLETHQISSGGNSDFSSDGENTMSPRSQDSPARLPNRVSVTNSPKHKNHHSNTNRMDTPVYKNSVPHRMEDIPIQRNGLSTKMAIENMENNPVKKISFGSSQVDSGKSGKSHENERNTHESNVNQSSGKNSHASGMLNHENGRTTHESSRMSHENGRNSHENGRMTHESGRISYENGRMSHGSGNLSHESGKMSHMSNENGFVLHESTLMNGNVIMGRINGASRGYSNENGVVHHGMESRSSENNYSNKSGSHVNKDEMDTTHRSNPSTESPRRQAASYGSPRRQITTTNDSPRFKGVSISNVKPVTMSSPEKSNPSSSRTRNSGKRFISLESPGASDFEDAIQDNENEIRRNQVYQKLQEDMKECGEIGNRERVSEHRLTKSQGDLSEGHSQRKKAVNSAPHVKHLEDLDKFPMLGETPSPVESSPKLDSEPISTTPTGIASSQPNTPTDPTTPTETNEMALETIEKSMPKNSTPPKPRPSLAKRRTEQMSRRESRESFNSRHSLSQDPNGAFKKPKEGMQDTMVLLESTDWESIMKGLKGLVRLVRFHKELVEGNLHSICVLLGRHIKNLRSQVARAACLAATDMFDIHKKTMEPELEELAGPLLQRTADTNRFLRADALKALDAMARQCSSGKVVQVLNLRGVHHHNGVVRCATARLFSGIVGRLGHEKFFALPKETRDKVIRSGAEMLTEGSLETRKHAKEMFTQLVPSGLLQRSLLEVVPPATLRHITKIIASLKIQI